MLDSIGEVVALLPRDKIESGVIYLELSQEAYQELIKEVEQRLSAFILSTRKEPDIGECTALNYQGYKVLLTWSKDAKSNNETLYVAFKTKIN